MDIGISKVVKSSFSEARENVVKEFEKEGFGILTEIDVKATLKKKLDINFRNYLILGACNPPFAHEALSRDLSVGLLMPCNITIHEDDDNNVVVSAMNVELAMGSIVPGLADLAKQINIRVIAAMDRLQ